MNQLETEPRISQPHENDSEMGSQSIKTKNCTVSTHFLNIKERQKTI